MWNLLSDVLLHSSFLGHIKTCVCFRMAFAKCICSASLRFAFSIFIQPFNPAPILKECYELTWGFPELALPVPVETHAQLWGMGLKMPSTGMGSIKPSEHFVFLLVGASCKREHCHWANARASLSGNRRKSPSHWSLDKPGPRSLFLKKSYRSQN